MKKSKYWASTFFINKKFLFKSIGISINGRRTDGIMGRFGGGWNWKLGFQIGGNSIIISLLIIEISIWKRSKNEKTKISV